MNNIYKELLKVALPPIIGSLGIILFESIDIYWIGKLGPKAVAGVAAASFITWTVYSLSKLSEIGASSLISQYFGASKKNKIFLVAKDSFFLTLFISIFSGIILLTCAEKIFILMGLDKESTEHALSYFNIIATGLPILFTFSLLEQIFNAHSNNKISNVILAFSLLINIILDPILIFGYSVFPRLGIKGAALATIISQFIGVLIRIYFLRKFNYIPKLKSFLYPTFTLTRKILKIGYPSSLSNAVWSLSFPFLTVIITKFGMKPLAGLNIAHRFEGFPYFFGLGLSVAMSALVGKEFGAKKREGIWRIFSHGVVLTTLVMAPVSLVFIFIPEKLMFLLNSDPEIIKSGAEYLKIIGYFEIFLGWELAIEGAFNGIGNTKPYMMIRIPLTLLRIPLAYILSFNLGMGIYGVWWAITLSTLLKGTAMFGAFYMNKTNKILLKKII